MHSANGKYKCTANRSAWTDGWCKSPDDHTHAMFCCQPVTQSTGPRIVAKHALIVLGYFCHKCADRVDANGMAPCVTNNHPPGLTACPEIQCSQWEVTWNT